MAFEHYDKCSLLLPMDGANNGTTFTDWSPNPKTVTRFGDTKTVTSVSKYYGSSGYFDGTGDYLSVANTGGFLDLRGIDVTISMYVYLPVAQNTRAIFTIGKPTIPGAVDLSYAVTIDPSGYLAFNTYAAAGVSFPIVDTATRVGEWLHLEYVRYGTTLNAFVNGVSIGTAIRTGTENYDSSYILTVGRRDTSLPREFQGYLQDVALFKGVALHTSNFTPPARLIGEVTGNVVNELGNPVQRTIIAVPRSYPTKLHTTQSDPTSGNYTLRCPSVDTHVAAFHEGTPQKADLVVRTVPV